MAIACCREIKLEWAITLSIVVDVVAKQTNAVRPSHHRSPVQAGTFSGPAIGIYPHHISFPHLLPNVSDGSAFD